MKAPFTTEQFFSVFEEYNTSVFPAQLIILLLGLIMFGVVVSKQKVKDQTVGGILGILWIWMGAVYQIRFFAIINPPAYAFGSLFILQGIFILMESFGRKKLVFHYNGKLKDNLSLFFILFGLIIYPVISFLLEGNLLHTISFGLPCPTTIATFGFLMLADKRFSKYLLIIPSLWALIGTTAALQFGVYQDFMLVLAAVIANSYILGNKGDVPKGRKTMNFNSKLYES